MQEILGTFHATQKLIGITTDSIENFTLESIIDILPKDITDVLVIDKNKVVEAFKNQIPEKPKSIDTDCNYFECATCGETIYSSDDLKSHKYCLNCGQAIDWSE